MEETPPMDQNNHDLNEPWDPVTDRSIMLEKNKEIKKSKYIHSTLVDGTGVIIQFINSQPAHAKGAAEVFGGIRINLMDPERVPNYLDIKIQKESLDGTKSRLALYYTGLYFIVHSETHTPLALSIWL